jgi:hypothetical protein
LCGGAGCQAKQTARQNVAAQRLARRPSHYRGHSHELMPRLFSVDDRELKLALEAPAASTLLKRVRFIEPKKELRKTFPCPIRPPAFPTRKVSDATTMMLYQIMPPALSPLKSPMARATTKAATTCSLDNRERKLIQNNEHSKSSLDESEQSLKSERKVDRKREHSGNRYGKNSERSPLRSKPRLHTNVSCKPIGYGPTSSNLQNARDRYRATIARALAINKSIRGK